MLKSKWLVSEGRREGLKKDLENDPEQINEGYGGIVLQLLEALELAEKQEEITMYACPICKSEYGFKVITKGQIEIILDNFGNIQNTRVVGMPQLQYNHHMMCMECNHEAHRDKFIL